jgi:hypothetical protein
MVMLELTRRNRKAPPIKIKPPTKAPKITKHHASFIGLEAQHQT